VSARNDCRYPGSHRAFADFKFAFAIDQRGVADFDTSHIGNGIERPRRAFKRNAQIPRTRLFAFCGRPCGRGFLRLACRSIERDCEREGEQEASKPLRCHRSSINYQLSTINFFVRLRT
jgi:hypothetical protein